jgi:hypothetical protein
MKRFVVDVQAPEEGWTDVQALSGAARSATAPDRSEIRFVRAVFLPEDGSCLLVFEADDVDVVRTACAAVGIEVAAIGDLLPATADPLDRETLAPDVPDERARAG